MMKMPRPIPCPECSALAPAEHRPGCSYGKEFFDQEIEPDTICGNCDYHTTPGVGGQICGNPRSPRYLVITMKDDQCGRWFWPCSKRWPDCDHG